MTQRKSHIDTLGALLLVYCSASMGINQALIKIVNAGFAPVFQAGLRSACALLPVLLFAVFTRKRLSLSDGSFWPGIVAGLFFAFEFLLLFVALEYTTVSRASIFFYTMPLWTAIAAHFLIDGEKLTPIRTAGLLVAIAGVSIALGHNATPASEKAFIGDLYCLLAATLWSGIILVARTTRFSRAAPEMQLLYQLAVSALVLIPLSPLFGPMIREFDAFIGLVFSVQVLVIVCVGFLTWFWLLSVYPASSMASFSFLAPVFGVFFGWLILGEEMDSTIIAALALVCAGVYLVSRRAPTKSVHEQ